MSKHLPAKIDPYRFSANAQELEGSFLLKDLPRLSASLFDTQGEVAVTSVCGVDEEGIRYCRGQIKTNLILQCQRCMESFNYEIIDDFVLGVVSTEEESESLPERYDPIVVKEGMLDIQEMVEDELIVSLPIVPMHDPKNCKVKLPLDSGIEAETSKESPFKVIEFLRTKRDTK